MIIDKECGYYQEEIDDEYSPYPGECEDCYRFKICLDAKGLKKEDLQMPITNLKDTVDGMLSADYKERFKAEYLQTNIRYEKLKDFCNRIEVAEMMGIEGPKHDCPLELLREQQRYMGLYLSILAKRAIIEGVELPK